MQKKYLILAGVAAFIAAVGATGGIIAASSQPAHHTVTAEDRFRANNPKFSDVSDSLADDEMVLVCKQLIEYGRPAYVLNAVRNDGLTDDQANAIADVSEARYCPNPETPDPITH